LRPSQARQALPEILIVRVEDACAPFETGEEVAIAYNEPGAGRVVRREFEPADSRSAPAATPSLPACATVTVRAASGPYREGESARLWFVDPRYVRVEPARDREPAPAAPASSTRRGTAVSAEPTNGTALPVRSGGDGGTTIPAALAAVRLQWSGDRVRRFVQVVDRLFTVERLGWYRHALAMRLLLPDEIRCADAAANAAAALHLQAAHDAAIAALGGPLLEAFMPNFAITPEWLDSLDEPAGVRALAQLRSTLESDGGARSEPPAFVPDASSTVGMLTAADFASVRDGSFEATVPLFVAWQSTFPEVSRRLAEYRRTLLELFGQTAGSAKLVRLTQMTQPCHALDDSLFHLAGTVGEAFGGLANP
jgi:hypothetical protein